MARKRGPAHNSVHSAAPGPSAHGAETRRDTPRAWRARPRSHAEAAGRQPSPRATSLQAAFRHDSHKLRRMELQVVFHLPRRLFGIPRAYPHAKRPRHHHRQHHVQVAPPREDVLVVAVVALAVVDLDIPMRPDNFRKLLRRARVGVERRDMPGDLLRGLADAFADVPAVLVLLSGLPRLPDLTVRPDYCPGAGEAGLDRVLDAEHLRHADFPASPVQFFFLTSRRAAGCRRVPRTASERPSGWP